MRREFSASASHAASASLPLEVLASKAAWKSMARPDQTIGAPRSSNTRRNQAHSTWPCGGSGRAARGWTAARPLAQLTVREMLARSPPARAPGTDHPFGAAATVSHGTKNRTQSGGYLNPICERAYGGGGSASYTCRRRGILGETQIRKGATTRELVDGCVVGMVQITRPRRNKVLSLATSETP